MGVRDRAVKEERHRMSVFEQSEERRAASTQSMWLLEDVVRLPLEENGVCLPTLVGIVLVRSGLREAAAAAGLSTRSLRRRFEATGCTTTRFAVSAKQEAVRRMAALRWRTDRMARTLGYSTSSSFRRFLSRVPGADTATLGKTRCASGRESKDSIRAHEESRILAPFVADFASRSVDPPAAKAHLDRVPGGRVISVRSDLDRDSQRHVDQQEREG